MCFFVKNIILFWRRKGETLFGGSGLFLGVHCPQRCQRIRVFQYKVTGKNRATVKNNASFHGTTSKYYWYMLTKKHYQYHTIHSSGCPQWNARRVFESVEGVQKNNEKRVCVLKRDRAGRVEGAHDLQGIVA